MRIQIGALPEADVRGRLIRIAPKAREEEGSTLFDVEVAIDDAGGTVLRAGYSANADIIIQEKQDVLLIPERLLVFDEEETYVELPPASEEGEPLRQLVSIGLSDGLQVEIVSGLDEGAQIMERAPRDIE